MQFHNLGTQLKTKIAGAFITPVALDIFSVCT